MKKIKHLLFGFAFILINLFIIKINTYAATEDTEPPTIKSVSIVENKEYSLGEKVYLNLDVNDDITGINRIDIFITDGMRGSTASINDFGSKPYFEVPKSLINGEYQITEIKIYDNNNNCRQYNEDGSATLCKEAEVLKQELKLKVNDSEVDNVAPEIKNIDFDKTDVKYGEEVKIKVEASDEGSGVRQVQIFLKSDSFKDLVSFFLDYDESSKSFVGSYKPYKNGKYELFSILIDDNDFNQKCYQPKSNKEENLVCDVIDDKTFTVTGAADKYSTVSIDKINYEFKQLSTPNIYKINIKLNDKDSIVDFIKVSIGRVGVEEHRFDLSIYKDETGDYNAIIDIDQFCPEGKYEIKHIYLYPTIKDDGIASDINSKIKYNKEVLFEIVGSKQYDVVTSTTDKELIEKIKNAKYDASIAINSMADPLIKKEVFEAIKGTNKTIYIESSGIIWVFNGKRITNPKDIDVTTSVDFYYNSRYVENLNKYLKKGVSISFANNGELPGVAKIRLKADYVFRDYLGTHELFAYQYVVAEKEEKIAFIKVATEIKLSEDGYYDFYIMHNSEYVISPEEVSKEVSKEEIVTEEGYKEEGLTEDGLIDKKEYKDKESKQMHKNQFIIFGVVTVMIILLATLITIKKK